MAIPNISQQIMHSNITDFLTNGKQTLICSDYEGTSSIKQINVFVNAITDDNKQVIYLGDLFDNTSDCSKKSENYCSLKMLKYLVDYPDKSRYVVGNRDINKIKLVQLLNFVDNTPWWRNKDDDIPKTTTQWVKTKDWVKLTLNDMYIDIVSKLIIDNMNNNDIWEAKTMEYYVPFWSKLPDVLVKNWRENGDFIKPMTTLYNRFLRIFGTDTKIGTMSADNILNGIPNELFKDNIDNVITGIKSKLTDITKINNIDLEIQAALVFTIFMRMLDQSLYKPNLNKKMSFTDKTDIDGYLWKYLSQASPALYANINNELFLFSHGGITNEFVKIDSLTKLNEITLDQWKLILNSPTLEQEIGTDVDETTHIAFINNKIQSYNKHYQKILQSCFANPKFNKELMILLAISAPAENNNLLRVEHKYLTSSYSPIQPKRPKASNLTMTASSTKIYNIWGHASVSFGYGFKKVAQNMYYISTDFSTSLYKDKICTQNYNENNLNLFIKYTNKQFYLDLNGTIYIDNSFIINKDKTNKIIIGSDSNINKILSSEAKEYQVLVIDNKIDNKIDNLENEMTLEVKQEGPLNDTFFHDEKQINADTQLVSNDNNIDYIYNGEITYNSKKYNLLSYFKFDFPIKRRMLILNSITNPMSTNPMSGGYRKKRSIHKSKKNRLTKNKLYKKRQNHSKRAKKSKSKQ